MATQVDYRHIKEGHGGVFQFTNGFIPYIGTYSCVTCVGVYLPIDDNRCFCAHINAFVSETQTNGRKEYTRLDITAAEGEQIKQITLKKLRASAKDNYWDPANVDFENAIVVCPQLFDRVLAEWDAEMDLVNYRNTGWYVMQGIKEFFSNATGLTCCGDSQGFVVNHKDRQNSRLKIAYKLDENDLNRGDFKSEDSRFVDVLWKRHDEGPKENWMVECERQSSTSIM